MKIKTVKWIIAGVIVVLLIVIVLLDATGRTVNVRLVWDNYLENGGSDDISHFKLYEVTQDTIIFKVWSDSIHYSLTEHDLVIENDDKIHYFVMTAVDESGNESEFSNVAILDLIKPTPVLNLRFE